MDAFDGWVPASVVVGPHILLDRFVGSIVFVVVSLGKTVALSRLQLGR